MICDSRFESQIAIAVKSRDLEHLAPNLREDTGGFRRSSRRPSRRSEALDPVAPHRVAPQSLSNPVTGDRFSSISFEAKNGFRQIFPRGGKSYIFPQAVKTRFSQTLHFMGKQAISRERESYFRGKIFPEREDLPSQG